jgi:hypothetical protein
MWSKCDCADPNCDDNNGQFQDEVIRGLQLNDDDDQHPNNGHTAAVVELEESAELLNTEPFEEIKVSIAIDSGCGKHVSPPSLLPGYTVMPSESSRRNQHFIGAGGDRIKNHGEAEINLLSSESKLHSKFQVADVTRMLLSVSQVCDNDCTVQFDKQKGWVTDKQGKVIATFPRVGGLYVAEMALKDPNAHKRKPDAGFTRPGATA